MLYSIRNNFKGYILIEKQSRVLVFFLSLVIEKMNIASHFASPSVFSFCEIFDEKIIQSRPPKHAIHNMKMTSSYCKNEILSLEKTTNNTATRYNILEHSENNERGECGGGLFLVPLTGLDILVILLLVVESIYKRGYRN